MSFFGESMIQNNEFIAAKEPEQSKNIVSMPNPCFPNIIRPFKLFEKLTGHNRKLLYQIKNKKNFLNLFLRERINVPDLL